jgi:hypothetical protein
MILDSAGVGFAILITAVCGLCDYCTMRYSVESSLIIEFAGVIVFAVILIKLRR